MAYVLEALIVRGAPGWPEPIARLGGLVPLHDPSGVPLGLLLLTEALLSKLGGDPGDRPVLGFLQLRPHVANLAAEASMTAPVAYVHAVFFGGGGFQAAVGWRGGKVAFGPRFTATHRRERPHRRYQVIRARRPTGALVAMAIDEALQFIGVTASGDDDEFDTVGLGAHRWTEDW